MGTNGSLKRMVRSSASVFFADVLDVVSTAAHRSIHQEPVAEREPSARQRRQSAAKPVKYTDDGDGEEGGDASDS